MSILLATDCGGRSSLDDVLVTSAGGVLSTGGALTTGGVKAIGGNPSTGGTGATGGSKTTGGATSAGGAAGGTGGKTSAGGMVNTGGNLSTGGGMCCGAVISRCNDGEFVGMSSTYCPQGAQCHVETQYCGVCSHQIWCADYGDAGTGGNTALGGATSTGGTNGAGGAIATGGTTSTNVDAGSGCTGNLETVQSTTGLCVAKMVTIDGPASDAASTDYEIDATEVTRGQYEQWVATNPALPDSSDASCGWKSASSDAGDRNGYAANSTCMTTDVCQGPNCDHYPVVCVDWCDAYYYCAAVSKRLCGKIGGGSNPSSSDSDASTSQWYRACSSGGANTYSYGNTFQAKHCNAYDCSENGNDESLPVATLSTCQSSVSGYTGVYDLSGNVAEWEDSCYEILNLSPGGVVISILAGCLMRGGAFDTYGFSGYAGCTSDSACVGSGGDVVDTTYSDLGFRCCSP